MNETRLNLVKAEISKFIDFQKALVFCFFEKYPELKDDRWLLSGPKMGEIEINGRVWIFTHHGAGYRFEDKDAGYIIDVHDRFHEPQLIDAWRISTFRASASPDIDPEEDVVSERVVEEDLQKLASMNILIKPFVNGKHYCELSA